jgi:phage terminase Nu1 subunit (DNA packaging protein)
MPSLEYVTQKKFAEMCHCSMANISLALKRGLISRDERGVLLSAPENLAYLNKRNPTLQTEKTIPKRDREILINPDALERIREESDEKENLIFLAKHELDRRKVIAQIEAQQIKNEKERNELVSRKMVETVFAEIYTVDVQEFLPLAISLPDDAAAVFGSNDDTKIHELRQKANKEIYRILEHRKRILDDFIQGLKG